MADLLGKSTGQLKPSPIVSPGGLIVVQAVLSADHVGHRA